MGGTLAQRAIPCLWLPFIRIHCSLTDHTEEQIDHKTRHGGHTQEERRHAPVRSLASSQWHGGSIFYSHKHTIHTHTRTCIHTQKKQRNASSNCDTKNIPPKTRLSVLIASSSTQHPQHWKDPFGKASSRRNSTTSLVVPTAGAYHCMEEMAWRTSKCPQVRA